MDSLLNKIVNTLTGDKVAQSGKDYWVDDSKVKACYECETPFSVFVRRHHCRICGRIFCSNCTVNCIPAPRDAVDQQWLRVCNYCHRMRQRDDDSSERGQSGTAEQLLLGSVQAADSTHRVRQEELTSNGTTGDGQTSPTKARHTGSLARSSASSEGALTWEVPAVLDRSFGPTAEIVAETGPVPAAPAVPAAAQTEPVAAVGQVTAGSAAGLQSAGAAVAAAASPANGTAHGVSPIANSSNTPSPIPGGSTGLHPLVQLNRQEFAIVAEEHLQQLLWQLLQAEEVKEADVWMPIVLRLVTEASKALLPAAAAAFGQQDPRFYVKVKRLPDMGRPSDSRVVRGVVAKKNVAHRRMRTDLQQPCVALLSGALEYQRVANKLSSFDTLLEQEREHLRLAVARIAAAKPDLLLVERSVARSAQEELLARGISLVQHTKPELLERLGRCMGVKVAASVEELSPQLVGTCSRFRVEPLPASNAPQTQQQQQQTQAQPAATADSAAAGSTSAHGPTATANGGSGLDLTTMAATGTAAPGNNSSISSVLQPMNTPHLPRPGVAKPLPVSATPAAAKTLTIFDGCPLPLGCTVLLWGPSAAELTKLKRIVKFGVLAAYHSGLECAFLAEELALGTAALATSALSREASLFRSIARATISSSRDATNPEHLVIASRLLLSLSPHVVVPEATEKERQHAAALRLQQQRHGAAAQAEQQQHILRDQDDRQQPAQLSSAANGPVVPLQEPVTAINGAAVAAISATVAASGIEATSAEAEAAAVADEAPGTPGSAVLAEPEFTDPLRRVTHHGDDDILPDENGDAAEAAAAAVGADAVPQVAPLWLQGLQLYDRQHVYLSMACRNPRRGLMCEPPAIKRIDYYCQSDLSLAAFIVAAAPHAQKKCQQPGCGDGVTCHVRTFLHAGSRITLSIATLPANEALPGEDRGQVWMWMRPKGSRQQPGSTSQAGVRRLPLSQACACMSFGMFLSLCFSAPGLEVLGTPLHSGFVRYFGLGRSVMCLHQDIIYPSTVAVPRVKISYSLNAQLMWLKQEAAELCQESNEAFDVLESALQSHPYFKTQAAAQPPAMSPLAAVAAAFLPSSTPHAASASSEVTPDLSAAAEGEGFDDRDAADTAEGVAAPDGIVPTSSAGAAAAAAQPASAAAAAAAAESASKGSSGPLASLSAMLSAVRKDRSSFMDRVNEVVQRATPETPTMDEATGGHSMSGNNHVMWDEQLMSGVLELNRLQRSLAITTLTWAATLQEPALFTQMLAATSTAGPAAMATAAAATASAVAVSGSPLAAAAAAVLAQQGSGSAHGGSMFHLPPAVAAQRMGISDGSEAGDHSIGTSGVSVPIMTHAAGPIAVQAVANLVASEAATTAAGGLLEGSQQVMMAVAQRAGSGASLVDSGSNSGDGSSSSTRLALLDDAALAASTMGVRGTSSSRFGQHARSSSVGSPRSPRARWALAAAAAVAGEGSSAVRTLMSERGSVSMGPRVGSTGSLPALAAAQEAAAGGSIYSSSLGSRLGSSNGVVSSSLRSSDLTGAPPPAAAAVGQGGSTGSPSTSQISSSMQSKQQQQALHRRVISNSGSVATAATSAVAANSGDDGSSDDGEVSHDRFVAWMTSHEIATPETDDMSDFYPEQLPDWDETAGVPAAAGGLGPAADLAPAAAPALPAVAAADRVERNSLRPPTPPGTPDLGSRLDPTVVAPPAAAAAAAHGATQPVSHRRTGSTEAAVQASDKPIQQQPQSSSGAPAGLAPIKTTAAAAASRSSSGVPGAVGLQQIARVALPGRALMPAGISDTVIPIFDAEPTSIAAYFLSSRAYQLQLNAAMKQILHGEQRPSTQQSRQQTSAGSSSDGPNSSAAAAAGGYQPLPTAAIPVVSQHGRSISQDYTVGRGAAGLAAQGAESYQVAANSAAAGRAIDSDPLGAVAAAGGGVQQDRSASDAPSSNGSIAASTRQQQQQRGSNPPHRGLNPKQPDWLALLLSPEPLHVKNAFDDDSPGMPWLRAKFSVTAYFAPQFAELRRRCIAGGEAAYITSLCRCRKWASRGGKSNAYFAKTRDDRFIVKSLSKPEKASFLEFAPAYFEHMARAAASGKPTALAKVAGVYSITIRSQSGNPLGGQGPGGQAGGPYKDGTIDVLVMENIFYDRQITRIYDLKGSERSRFNADAAANPQDVGAVHLDDNLRRANLQQPILVDEGMLRAMERALWSDTSFLAGLGVMDYSLLVGVDKEHNQLVVAIIDFIRTYTWDKQLETWVKSSGILGGNGKEPTIVSPKQYMRRFRTAISSYFTVVPDGHEVEAAMDADAA